jgi:hypothetical protein
MFRICFEATRRIVHYSLSVKASCTEFGHVLGLHPAAGSGPDPARTHAREVSVACGLD